MADRYVRTKRGKGYTQKTDRFGNVHTFSEEEYKGHHGHRVTGPSGEALYDRPQGTFRSGKLRSLGATRTGSRTGHPRSDVSGKKELHKAVCASCGKECTVPFRPTRAVFCNACFAKRNSPMRPRTW